MVATTPTLTGDDDDPQAAQDHPVPDEDGPHDVPDDTVIEKTLPTMRDGDSQQDDRP